MARSVHRVLVASSCALLFACGGDPSAPADPTPDVGPLEPEPPREDGFTVSVTPATVDVGYGSKVEVAVALTRRGAVGEIALSARGLPAGITATFAPAAVPAGESASSLTLAIGREAPPGRQTVTIVGTSAGKEVTATVTLNVTTVSVNGKVALGGAGTTVILVDGEDRREAVTVDGGAFTFKDVRPPYDLYTFAHSDDAMALVSDHVVYYRGLKRPDPTIERASAGISTSVLLPEHKATITTTLEGTAIDPSLDNPVFVFWTGSEDIRFKATSGKTFAFEPTWKGFTAGGKRAGTVHALQFDGGLESWRGYGSAAVALDPGDVAAVTLVMAAPPTANVEGTLTAPSGFPNPTSALTFRFDSRPYKLSGTGDTAPYKAVIPVVPSLEMGFEFSSKKGEATTTVAFSGITGKADVSYALVAPPAFASPAPATMVGHETSFAWDRPADSVSVVRWEVGKVRYDVVTAAGDATVPKIPGASLPTDNGTWSVQVYGPMTGIDDIATPVGRSLDGAPVRYHAASDGARSFVWKP